MNYSLRSVLQNQIAIIITDQEIDAFMQEPKPLPPQWCDKFITRDKCKNTEHILKIKGAAGNKFTIIIREHKSNPSSNFSVVLAVYSSKLKRLFRLRRYNGNSHQHTNDFPIGEDTDEEIRGFHIHYATELYQREGEDEDDYAKKTDRYTDVPGALHCVIKDANFHETSMF